MINTETVVSMLREQSKEIAARNYYGWGNTMTVAADKIQQLERQNAELVRMLASAIDHIDEYSTESSATTLIAIGRDLIRKNGGLE